MLNTLYAYLQIVFDQMDCFLGSLFGGPEDSPISLDAARAARAGKPWGCFLCRWLHWTLRQNHCQRILAGEPTTGFAAISAAIQLLIIFICIFYGPFLLF